MLGPSPILFRVYFQVFQLSGISTSSHLRKHFASITFKYMGTILLIYCIILPKFTILKKIVKNMFSKKLRTLLDYWVFRNCFSQKICIFEDFTYTGYPKGVTRIKRLVPEPLLRHEAWKVFVTIQFANSRFFSSFICITTWRHARIKLFNWLYMQKLFLHK